MRPAPKKLDEGQEKAQPLIVREYIHPNTEPDLYLPLEDVRDASFQGT